MHGWVGVVSEFLQYDIANSMCLKHIEICLNLLKTTDIIMWL